MVNSRGKKRLSYININKLTTSKVHLSFLRSQQINERFDSEKELTYVPCGESKVFHLNFHHIIQAMHLVLVIYIYIFTAQWKIENVLRSVDNFEFMKFTHKTGLCWDLRISRVGEKSNIIGGQLEFGTSNRVLHFMPLTHMKVRSNNVRTWQAS